MTQRDGMGREEGEGFRMGNTCIPVADSFRYLAKPYNIVKFTNKIKFFKKRKKLFFIFSTQIIFQENFVL